MDKFDNDAQIVVPLLNTPDSQTISSIFNIDCDTTKLHLPKLMWIKGNRTNYVCYPILVGNIVNQVMKLPIEKPNFKDLYMSLYIVAGLNKLKVGDRPWRTLVEDVISRSIFYISGGKYSQDSEYIKEYLKSNFNIYNETFIISTFFSDGYSSDEETLELIYNTKYTGSDLTSYRNEYLKTLTGFSKSFSVYKNNTEKLEFPIIQSTSVYFFNDNIPKDFKRSIEIKDSARILCFSDFRMIIGKDQNKLTPNTDTYLVVKNLSSISLLDRSLGTPTLSEKDSNSDTFLTLIDSKDKMKEFVLPSISKLDARNKIYYADKQALKCICLGNISKIPQNYFDLLDKNLDSQAWVILEKYVWLPFVRDWFREEEVLQDISKYVLSNGEDYFNPIFKSFNSNINQLIQTSSRLPVNIEDMKDLIKRNINLLDILDSKFLSLNLKSEDHLEDITSGSEEEVENLPIDKLIQRLDFFDKQNSDESTSSKTTPLNMFSCNETI